MELQLPSGYVVWRPWSSLRVGVGTDSGWRGPGYAAKHGTRGVPWGAADFVSNPKGKDDRWRRLPLVGIARRRLRGFFCAGCVVARRRRCVVSSTASCCARPVGTPIMRDSTARKLLPDDNRKGLGTGASSLRSTPGHELPRVGRGGGRQISPSDVAARPSQPNHELGSWRASGATAHDAKLGRSVNTAGQSMALRPTRPTFRQAGEVARFLAVTG